MWQRGQKKIQLTKLHLYEFTVCSRAAWHWIYLPQWYNESVNIHMVSAIHLTALLYITREETHASSKIRSCLTVLYHRQKNKKKHPHECGRKPPGKHESPPTVMQSGKLADTLLPVRIQHFINFKWAKEAGESERAEGQLAMLIRG